MTSIVFVLITSSTRSLVSCTNAQYHLLCQGDHKMNVNLHYEDEEATVFLANIDVRSLFQFLINCHHNKQFLDSHCPHHTLYCSVTFQTHEEALKMAELKCKNHEEVN